MPPIKRTVSRRNTIRSLPSRVIRRPSFPSEIIDIIHQRDGSVDKNWFLPSKIHGSFHEETGNASCLFFFHPGKSSRTSICLIFLFSSMNLKTNPLPIGKGFAVLFNGELTHTTYEPHRTGITGLFYSPDPAGSRMKIKAIAQDTAMPLLYHQSSIHTPLAGSSFAVSAVAFVSTVFTTYTSPSIISGRTMPSRIRHQPDS